MEAPSPEAVRRELAELDALEQKVVIGLWSVMVKTPTRVREREWIAEQLAQVTLLTGEFEADGAPASVAAVGGYVRPRSDRLLGASFHLFQRVGLDLAPRAAEGFTFDEALESALAYLPRTEPADSGASGALVRDLGEQPLARLMSERGLTPHDLVAASTEQLTHKMVTRAVKGRRLTPNAMGKVLRAWNLAAKRSQRSSDLFNYEP